MEIKGDKGRMFLPSRSFQDLLTWQRAHEFVILVYQVTKSFPAEERFGLCSQFQRAAVSIPANIAEGYKRLGKQEKLRFLNISQGSLEECRYYAILSSDLSYIQPPIYQQLMIKLEETSKLLNAYIKGINNTNYTD